METLKVEDNYENFILEHTEVGILCKFKDLGDSVDEGCFLLLVFLMFDCLKLL